MAKKNFTLIDYEISKRCKNPEVYHICHKCSKCGRKFNGQVLVTEKKRKNKAKESQ